MAVAPEVLREVGVLANLDVPTQLRECAMSKFLGGRDQQVVNVQHDENERCPESLEVDGGPLDHALVAKVLDGLLDVLMPHLPCEWMSIQRA